ncbi:carboxylesterase/lipase family protein [Nocardia yamanashiensis]|uniref:carboxylesterase/lipase family protein n=1 Tax=Nocardia yamanashiensis TaxID=209247 RepID=UPI00082FEB3A|nr:carboxylesterase family protein [Nocardia yamanashiensis]
MEAIVSVTGGKIRGRFENGVTAFLGIPYAAAPVGPARFELPRPPAAWSGLRDATVFGPTCVQTPYAPGLDAMLGYDHIPGDDYLNVNVWTPDPGGSGLPVLVWIHGGAFTRGANSKPIYDGAAFARDGVVLVSINYRLGISGFAAVPGAPLNRGMHDQLCALRWVQENIAAFGGDPGRVTVFGESAGGMSVLNLMATPLAEGLFRQAIVQSANGLAVAAAEDAERVAVEIAGILGIEPTAAAFGELDPERIRTAQDAVGLALLSDPDPARWGATVIERGGGIMSLFPAIDGETITGVPSEILSARPDRMVPLLVGANAEEFRFYTIPSGLAAAITEQTLPIMLGRFGIDPDVAGVYRANRPDAAPADIFAAILTDGIFRDDVLNLAEAAATAGNPSYVYEFAWRSGIPDLGSCHVLELPFVFDNLATAHRLTGPNPPAHLATEMHAAWVRFATHGDPGWSRYEPGTRQVHVFDAPQSHDAADPRGDELRAVRAATARDRSR